MSTATQVEAVLFVTALFVVFSFALIIADNDEELSMRLRAIREEISYRFALLRYHINMRLRPRQVTTLCYIYGNRSFTHEAFVYTDPDGINRIVIDLEGAYELVMSPDAQVIWHEAEVDEPIDSEQLPF